MGIMEPYKKVGGKMANLKVKNAESSNPMGVTIKAQLKTENTLAKVFYLPLIPLKSFRCTSRFRRHSL